MPRKKNRKSSNIATAPLQPQNKSEPKFVIPLEIKIHYHAWKTPKTKHMLFYGDTSEYANDYANYYLNKFGIADVKQISKEEYIEKVKENSEK